MIVSPFLFNDHPTERHRDRLIAPLVFLAFALRVIYIFWCTNYSGYLSSDMGGYWQRAMERFQGIEFSVNQYAIWPPLCHILLAILFRLLDAMGMISRALEVVMVLNAALGAISVFFIYGIARKLTVCRQSARIAAVAYALSFPMIYFGAFLLSENFAIPLAIGALFFLVNGKHPSNFAFSGLLLGIASGIRPPFSVWGLPFAAYALFATGSREGERVGINKRAAIIFCLAFAAVLIAISLENRRISGGRVSGLSANGGLGLYVGLAKPYSLESFNEGFHYIIIPPQSTPYPERYRLKTFHPMYDQSFFLKLVGKYLAQHPFPLSNMLGNLQDLFNSPLFPGSGEALGINSLFPIWRSIFFAITLLSLAYPVLKPRQNSKGLLLFAMLFFMLGLHTVFSAEHRYAYGFYFVVLLLTAQIGDELCLRPEKLRTVLKALILTSLSVLLIWGGRALILRYSLAPVIKTEITKNKATLKDLDQQREPLWSKTLWFETIAFRPQNEFGHENHPAFEDLRFDFFVSFQVKAEVLHAGNYRFEFYVDDGVRFFVDGRMIAERPGEWGRFEEGKTGQVYLTEGIHDLKIDYYQGGGNLACVAAYQRIAPGEESLLIGHSSKNIKFSPLE